MTPELRERIADAAERLQTRAESQQIAPEQGFTAEGGEERGEPLRNSALSAVDQTAERWSISKDEEMYYGEYPSRDAAIEEAKAQGLQTFYVGKIVPPTPPGQYFDWDWFLDHVYCQDDYAVEWAEGALDCPKETSKQIEKEIRQAIEEVLERHGVGPSHFMIGDSERITVEPVPAAEPAGETA